MTFLFREDDCVELAREYADYLPAGSRGVVFCQYRTTPPSYEVNLKDSDGGEVGVIADEADLVAVRQGAEALDSAK